MIVINVILKEPNYNVRLSLVTLINGIVFFFFLLIQKHFYEEFEKLKCILGFPLKFHRVTNHLRMNSIEKCTRVCPLKWNFFRFFSVVS